MVADGSYSLLRETHPLHKGRFGRVRVLRSGPVNARVKTLMHASALPAVLPMLMEFAPMARAHAVLVPDKGRRGWGICSIFVLNP